MARKLKREMPQIKAAMVTRPRGREHREAAAEVGAVSILDKAYLMEELSGRFDRLAGMRSAKYAEPVP